MQPGQHEVCTYIVVEHTVVTRDVGGKQPGQLEVCTYTVVEHTVVTGDVGHAAWTT